MVLQIRPKHVAGIIIKYDLIRYKVLSVFYMSIYLCLIFQLIFSTAWISHLNVLARTVLGQKMGPYLQSFQRTYTFIVNFLFNVRSVITPCRMGQCICHFDSSKLETILFLRLNCPKAIRPKEQKFVTHISASFWLLLFYFFCFNVSHFYTLPLYVSSNLKAKFHACVKQKLRMF